MDGLIQEIGELPGVTTFGRVVGVRGLMIEVAGPLHAMSVGARLSIEATSGRVVPAEVVGFEGDRGLCLPFGALEGVRMGCRAVLAAADGTVRPSDGWLGRVVNALGEPIDGKGPLPQGAVARHLRAGDRKSTRLNSSHIPLSRMPSSA